MSIVPGHFSPRPQREEEREEQRDIEMYKSRLQELCHQKSWSLPTYTSSKGGPDHIPSFTATVSVNGIDFRTPSSAKSSKEAQNEAAKIAFNYFTTPVAVLPSSPPISSPAANESGTSELTNLEKLAKSDIYKNDLNSSGDGELKGAHYMYKNQLQNLAQKRNLSLPVYGSIREGQPHVPRFKATVTVDGQTFESPDFLSTVREAENAAAKIAIASLSDGIQELDAGVYKNLLQELAQKEGFSLPIYNTIQSGPSHLPTFFSTVEIEGEIFSGKPAKSKKQAEMIAAKVAWFSLEERALNRVPGNHSIVCQTQAALERVSISSSEPLQNHRPIVNSSSTQNMKSVNASGGITGDILLQVQSTGSLGANGGITDENQQDVSANINPGSNKPSISTSQLMFPQKTQTEVVPKTEELSFSARPLPQSKGSDTTYSSLQDPFPAETLLPEAGKSSAQLECSKRSTMDLSSGMKSSSGRDLLGNRIRVYPRGANIRLPEGAICLPISDNEWVAAMLNCAKSQS